MKTPKPEIFGVFCLRAAGGFTLLAAHGLPKLIRLVSGDPIRFANPIGIGPELSFILVVFAEFLCALFVTLGLFTRLAAIPVIITMTVAAFIQNAGNAFAQKELAFLYLIIFTALFFTGPGCFSLQNGLKLKMGSPGKLNKFLTQ